MTMHEWRKCKMDGTDWRQLTCKINREFTEEKFLKNEKKIEINGKMWMNNSNIIK